MQNVKIFIIKKNKEQKFFPNLKCYAIGKLKCLKPCGTLFRRCNGSHLELLGNRTFENGFTVNIRIIMENSLIIKQKITWKFLKTQNFLIVP